MSRVSHVSFLSQSPADPQRAGSNKSGCVSVGVLHLECGESRG